MAAPVSLLRPSAPKKDRVVSNHPAPGEAQLVAIKDMAQTLDQKIRQNGCKHANLPSKNEISLVNSGFVFVMFSFKPCQTISILPLSTIRTFKCESHVQIVSSGICSRHKFLSLQYVIPGQSQSGFHVVLREEGWMTIGWYVSGTWRCPFCGVTPRIIHGWHFCIETGDPEIRRFEKPPLHGWGMAGDLLTRALEGLPRVNTFGWSDDPSNYLGKL